MKTQIHLHDGNFRYDVLREKDDNLADYPPEALSTLKTVSTGYLTQYIYNHN